MLVPVKIKEHFIKSILNTVQATGGSLKGIVENSVINYSSSCRSKPERPSFIFGTQIKIFLMKSESSLILRRQQHNSNVPRHRNTARTSVK